MALLRSENISYYESLLPEIEWLGAVECTDCGAGKHSAVTAATSIDTCLDCAAGSFSAAGAFFFSLSLSPIHMSKNLHCACSQQRECKLHIDTESTQRPGSAMTGATTCTSCEPGTYLSAGAWRVCLLRCPLFPGRYNLQTYIPYASTCMHAGVLSRANL